MRRPDPSALAAPRHPWRLLTTLVLVVSGIAACNSDGRTLAPAEATNQTIPVPEPAQGAFILTSPGFVDESPLPAVYTCDGDDVMPPLVFTGVPERGVELVLVVDDLDDGGRILLFAAGIDPTLPGLEAGTLPTDAVLLENGEGRRGYDGPCPAPGTGEHRYFFTLYALETPSGLTADSPAFDARLTIGEQATAIAVIEGRYGA